MDEEHDDPSFTPRDDRGRKDKAGFKPSSMVDMKPCEDLHRYVVDKFHSSTKSKPALFEEIDLSTYKPTAKVASFLTSENRLLLWIKIFAVRYFDHLNNQGYRVSWQEQESYSCPTKSDKIILHVCAVENDTEEQLFTISVFISTGRIMIQGKKFADWSRDEFPTLLSIVNSLNESRSEGISGNRSSQDMSLYFTALPKLFTKCRDSGANTEDLNENTVTENAARVSEILDVTESLPVDKGTAETLRMSENITTLPPQLDPLTPNKINSFATLRNAVGNLEAEFTQLKITHTGNIEQLKDKTVQHDHLLKVQKTTLGGIADDLASSNQIHNDELQKHATLITKLQEENQALQKKCTKISEVNAALKTKQSQLEAEVTFLKDQMKALWEKIDLRPPEIASTASQTTPHVEEDIASCAPSEESKKCTSTLSNAHWNEEELLLVNIPTSNSFSPLQEPPEKPLENDILEASKENNPKQSTSSQNIPPNEVIFLCDSNGKFLDTKQMFSSKHQVKYTRAPLIEHARAFLQNEIHTPPHMILLHTGTNDLERSHSTEELVANILILITEASTKFPSSKIFFSTLLPRNDIPTSTVTSINNQLINSCSRLPNVQLIKHENLFSHQQNILKDNKHILKRHIGLFAKNLKDAIHGRVRRPAARNQPESQLLRHASYSNAVKNKPPYTHHWPHNLQTQPSLIPLVKPPAPHQTYTANTQIPPAQHQTGPHPYPETPHQTLPQAAKLVTACEETPSSRNNMANA